MKRAERRKAHEGTGTKRAAMRRREEMETAARACETNDKNDWAGGCQDRSEGGKREIEEGDWDQMREYTTKYALAARTSPIDARRTFSSSTAKNCRKEGVNTGVSRLLAFSLPRGQPGRAAHIVRTADVTRIVTLTERPFVRNDRHQSEPSGVRPVERRNPRKWQAR